MTIPAFPGRLVPLADGGLMAENILHPGAAPIGNIMALLDDGGGNPISGWVDPSTVGLLPTGGVAGQRLRKVSGADFDVEWAWDYYTIPVMIDGGGVPIVPGFKGKLYIDSPGTIVKVTVLESAGTPSGSAVLDLWKGTYAAPPTVADTICAAAKPTIVADTKYQDVVLTGWDVALASNDVLGINVDSCSNFIRLLLSLTIRKS